MLPAAPELFVLGVGALPWTAAAGEAVDAPLISGAAGRSAGASLANRGGADTTGTGAGAGE